MRVALVTGSRPPEPCGVGDFTVQLGLALQRKGADVHVISDRDWSARVAMSLKREISRLAPDVTHIQYPTFGFANFLGPQLLSLLMPLVVTLHETSQMHLLRRLSLYAFAVRSQRIVFTTEFERQYAMHRAPWIERQSLVIPLGTSIAPQSNCGKSHRNEIVHFGLIRRGKGLEEVLRFARLIRDRGLKFHIRIVGAVYGNHQEYFAELQRNAMGLPISWETNMTDEQVSEALSQARFAYLPFPDGASERRSSLMAALASKLVVVTTRGIQTPSSLDDVVEFANGADEALRKVEFLMSDCDAQVRILNRVQEYFKKHSWEKIADQHLHMYAITSETKRSNAKW